ncbi:hypothetical protein Droror1_Dr00017743 [Drosera rotundifolia]
MLLIFNSSTSHQGTIIFTSAFSPSLLSANNSSELLRSLQPFPSVINSDLLRSMLAVLLDVRFRVLGSLRRLRVLDLIEDELNKEDDNEVVDWISCFLEIGTCLVSLSFECVEQLVKFNVLERLVLRSVNLKKLRLNTHVSIKELCYIWFGFMGRMSRITVQEVNTPQNLEI